MSATFEIGIEGIGLWAPELPGWDAARAALCDKVEIVANFTARPAPTLLPTTERRRAPEAVLIALEAAQQACAMARREPRELAHVFASAYGDLAISDYLCATLARAPLEVSPTRFHNSVHNAAAGYWTIATGCRHASTAISAGDATFGAGLLEAALLAHSEAMPVLLAVYDVAAEGPLQDVIASRSRFATAFVVAPVSPAPAHARLRLRTREGALQLAPEPALLHANHRGNPAACSLPLLIALARGAAMTLPVVVGPQLTMDMEISF